MTPFDKLQPLLLLLAALLGIVAGRLGLPLPSNDSILTILLAFMLFFIFWQIPFKEWQSSWRNPKFTALQLCINFLWTPLFAFLLGSIFLNDHPALFVGFMMLMVTPCTDWYLVFTGLAKGNVPLAVSNLPLNLVLQLLLLPVYLFLLSGTYPAIEFNLFLDALTLLIIPFGLALLVRYLLFRTKRLFLIQKTTVVPPIMLAGAIFLMFDTHQSAVFETGPVLLLLPLPVLLLFVLNYFVAKKVSGWCRFSYPDRVSFTMITIARNSPIALAVAAVAFSSQPLVFVALLVGPLLELPTLYVLSHLLVNTKKSP